jgi:hypothetical protein
MEFDVLSETETSTGSRWYAVRRRCETGSSSCSERRTSNPCEAFGSGERPAAFLAEWRLSGGFPAGFGQGVATPKAAPVTACMLAGCAPSSRLPPRPRPSPARRGTNVCDFHGAKAPQVKRKARERLEEASDTLARELLRMATDPKVSESVRLSAIKDALDRGGISAKTAVEVEVGPPKPYEQILDGLDVIESGSRAEFRRSRGIAGNEQPPVERWGDAPGPPPDAARVRSQRALPPRGFDR